MVDKIAWPHVRLGNLITLKNGDYLPVELTCVDGTVPVYGGGDIKGYTSNSNCEPDTVIISRQGATCGTVRQVSSPFWATEHAMIVGIKYDGLLPRWGFYAMSNLNLGRLSMAAAQPGISQEKVKSQRIYLPPVDEQRRIADFLDEKCAQIDRAITSAEQSIQDYKAYKNSVIFQAVTKGLDPGALMKDSGVEWLGKVPSAWKVVPSKTLFYESKQKRLYGDARLTPSQNYGVIAQSEYMRRTGSKVVLADKGLDDWKHVEPLDFIISLRSFQGGLEMSKITGCVTWHYIVLRSKIYIHHDYYRFLFKSIAYIDGLRSTCQYLRDGQDLRYSNFVQVPLPLPPLDEQRRIAEFLDEKCAQIDRAVEAKQAIIDELKSYKKSLIYEVVTGKREV